MKTIRHLVLLCTLAGAGMVNGAGEPTVAEHVRFLAGFLTLKTNNSLTPDKKRQYFQELQSITGVSVESSRKFILSYKDRPESWKKVQEKIQSILEEGPVDGVVPGPGTPGIKTRAGVARKKAAGPEHRTGTPGKTDKL